MITVSTEAYISASNPSILLPNVPEGQYDVVIILQPKPNKIVLKHRKAGFITEKIWMSDDFNAPLDDFKEYM
jgi:hypothetical protein